MVSKLFEPIEALRKTVNTMRTTKLTRTNGHQLRSSWSVALHDGVHVYEHKGDEVAWCTHTVQPKKRLNYLFSEQQQKNEKTPIPLFPAVKIVTFTPREAALRIALMAAGAG